MKPSDRIPLSIYKKIDCFPDYDLTDEQFKICSALIDTEMSGTDIKVISITPNENGYKIWLNTNYKWIDEYQTKNLYKLKFRIKSIGYVEKSDYGHNFSLELIRK